MVTDVLMIPIAPRDTAPTNTDAPLLTRPEDLATFATTTSNAVIVHAIVLTDMMEISAKAGMKIPRLIQISVSVMSGKVRQMGLHAKIMATVNLTIAPMEHAPLEMVLV
jgi:hypothetical protein